MAIRSSDSETASVAETDDKRTKQARQWRLARMERFAQTQRRTHEWVNFEEIAELCSELDGSGVPNEAARENAYRNLERDLLSGDFEENGRSRVLYLHHYTVKTRMTRKWLQDAIAHNYDGDRGRCQFLPRCSIPLGMFQRWAVKHNLLNLLWRFQPEHAATVVVAQPTTSQKLPKSSKRRRPAEERIRQELEKKSPEYIDTPGDKTCWGIAKMLAEAHGSARNIEIDAKSKALKRYYADRLKDRSQD